MVGITNELDRIADSLESEGYIKEARDVDMISNTIERLAYDAKYDGKVKVMEAAIGALQKNNVQQAKNMLINIKTPWEQFIKFHGKKISDVMSAYAAYNGALDQITLGFDMSDTPEKAIGYLNDSIGFLNKAAKMINAAQFTVR